MREMDRGSIFVERIDVQHIISSERRPRLPYCEPTIQVLAIWPRICDCTPSQPGR